MRGPALLINASDSVRSRVGGWLGSRTVFRSHDLHRDLKDLDWFELNVYGITGRRFSPDQMRVLNAIWTYTSYPDTRIWNNRVAALSGSARSTGALGLAASVAVSEARIYGIGPGLGAYDFFVKALQETTQGIPLKVVVKEHLAVSRGIGGYGRPLTSDDERIEPLMALVREVGLGLGEHLRLAFQIDSVLHEGRWRLKMNYAALVAALCLDMGFSRQEFYLYVVHLFLAGMTPCYINALDQPEGTLLPLSCSHIKYLGHEDRSWRDRQDGKD